MDELTNSDIQREPDGQQNVDVQMEENASIESGEQFTEVVNDLEEMLFGLPLSTDTCISLVPYDLRKLNEECYTPKVVSIGPLHHGRVELRTMEREKVRCLKSFLGKVQHNLKELVSTIRLSEDRCRGFYGAGIELTSEDFVKMILLDVCFILEMFWKYDTQGWSSGFPPWLQAALVKDFVLLENQIPFFIVEELFDMAYPFIRNGRRLIPLTLCFFEQLNVQVFDPLPRPEIKHFLDLLRVSLLPRPPWPHRERTGEFFSHLYSATQLHEAGIKFKVSPSKCLLEFKFEDGVLEIPFIHLDDRTETFVRNVMAFEQCHLFREQYIVDFYYILDFLINTYKDVDLLCGKGIMVNFLGDSRAAASMINNLNKEILWPDMSANYNRLCKDLIEFYDNPWHSWKATLRREYFYSPWGTASTIAAVVFLVLTIIQAVCSIMQVVPNHK